MQRFLQRLEERAKCQLCKKWIEAGVEVAMTEYFWNGDWRFLPVHTHHPTRENMSGEYMIKQGELATEEWMPVVGFQGYSISNLGRVKSWETGRYIPTLRLGTAVVVKLFVRGEVMTKKVDRLVADAFLPYSLGYSELRHIDGDSTNCRASNLIRIGDEERDLTNKKRTQRGLDPLPYRVPKERVAAHKSLYIGAEGGAPLIGTPPAAQALIEQIQKPAEEEHYVDIPAPEPKKRKVSSRYTGKVLVNETGIVYDSIAQCALALDLNPSLVGQCLRGYRKMHHGYTFTPVDRILKDPERKERSQRVPKKSSKPRSDKGGGGGMRTAQKIREVKTGLVFDSQIKAGKHFNVNQSQISAQLRGAVSHVGGHIFERIEG